MKKLIVFLTFIPFCQVFSQGVFLTKTGMISFFSKATIENIDAKNTKVGVVLNTETNDLQFVVNIKNFVFKDAVMQEHFNEDYLESDKYPDSQFTGKINETIDYTKDGEYKVTATGKFNLHGVEKERTEAGTIIIKDGQITLKGEFYVLLKDYSITIPRLVFQNIAENIQVKLDATLVPFKR